MGFNVVTGIPTKSESFSKGGKTIKPVDYQTYPKAKSKKREKARKALKPGLRRSKRGKEYFETRANRSDFQPSKGI